MPWDDHPSAWAGAVLGEPNDVHCPLGCQGTMLSVRAFAYYPKPAYKAALFDAISVKFNQLPNILCFRKINKMD